MENGDTAKLSASPFRLVVVEFWVDGFQERAHEWDLHCWTDNAAFKPDIFCCR